MMTDKIYTTLAKIRDYPHRKKAYKRLVESIGELEKYGADTPITFRQIYSALSYKDTLSLLRTVDPKWYPLLQHYACDCVDAVRQLMADKRSTDALDVARRYADGMATDAELYVAKDAAWSALNEAWQVASPNPAPARAAMAAAWLATGSADAAAFAAAWAAAWASTETQMERLFHYCETGGE